MAEGEKREGEREKEGERQRGREREGERASSAFARTVWELEALTACKCYLLISTSPPGSGSSGSPVIFEQKKQTSAAKRVNVYLYLS